MSSRLKIGYVDGPRLQRAIIAGCEKIFSHEKDLNRINVFPIPDKDTGSNLKKTLNPALTKDRFTRESISECSKEISEAVASSALGYSGIIFAQFFQGLADALEGQVKVNTQALSAAVREGVSKAKSSLDSPVEGTVISVLEAWSHEIQRLSLTENDFVPLLWESFKTAGSALKKTPQQLDVLRKHRVVDSGGQAFVYFLEGILQLIEEGKPDISFFTKKSFRPRKGIQETADAALFCAECCIRRKNLNRLALMNELKTVGQNLIFYSSSDFAKIHISCTDPERIFSVAEQYGETTTRGTTPFSPDKPEQEKKPLALVADTTCDISDDYVENNDIFFIPIKIHIGDKILTDRQDIIPDEFYPLMNTSLVLPKTSQPNIMDFIRIYDHLLAHYNSIISVHLSKNLSGTHQTALQAARNVDAQRILIVDGKNISVGLGLILLEGIRALRDGLDAKSVSDRILKAVDQVEIYVGIPTLKYLVMGGRVPKTKGLIAGLLNINPILSINKEGKLEPIGKTRGKKNLAKKVMNVALERIQREDPSPARSSKETAKARLSFDTAVAHTNAPHAGKTLAEKIREEMGKNPVLVMNASPVLGAHAGTGAIGIAIIKGGHPPLSAESSHEETG